jgi:hypothetical protein
MINALTDPREERGDVCEQDVNRDLKDAVPQVDVLEQQGRGAPEEKPYHHATCVLASTKRGISSSA